MYRKRIIYNVILILFAIGFVGTADAETKTLTLQQAIEIAKQSNINLKQASNQINLGAIAV
ncbi:MAG: hypothetical protein ACM3SY_10155, partial [Candidatus Omnitrophota bacterium]